MVDAQYIRKLYEGATRNGDEGRRRRGSSRSYADDATIEDPIGAPLHRGSRRDPQSSTRRAAGTVTMKRVGPVHVARARGRTPLLRADPGPKAEEAGARHHQRDGVPRRRARSRRCARVHRSFDCDAPATRPGPDGWHQAQAEAAAARRRSSPRRGAEGVAILACALGPGAGRSRSRCSSRSRSAPVLDRVYYVPSGLDALDDVHRRPRVRLEVHATARTFRSRASSCPPLRDPKRGEIAGVRARPRAERL